MRKKSLFIFVFVMCIGFLIPRNAFAANVMIANEFIDYRFSIEDDENDNYTFKLYNKTGSLSFESVYDSQSGEYVFSKNYIASTYHNTFSENYIKYSDEILNISSKDDFDSMINRYHLHGYYEYDGTWGWNNFNIFDYVPLILENTNTGLKKIVFASLVINSSCDGNSQNFGSTCCYDPSVFLINNTNYDCSVFNYYYSNSFSNNISFMRNAVYDYSDELWEQLNNGPIASSEMSYDTSSVLLGENGSIDLSKPSIIRFNKKSELSKGNNNEDNNIVNVITNPKTWNNGVVILVISMIVIIGSSFVLIKRRNN